MAQNLNLRILKFSFIRAKLIRAVLWNLFAEFGKDNFLALWPQRLSSRSKWRRTSTSPRRSVLLLWKCQAIQIAQVWQSNIVFACQDLQQSLAIQSLFLLKLKQTLAFTTVPMLDIVGHGPAQHREVCTIQVWLDCKSQTANHIPLFFCVGLNVLMAVCQCVLGCF